MDIFGATLAVCLALATQFALIGASNTTGSKAETTSWGPTTKASVKSNCSENEVDLECIKKDLEDSNSSLIQLIFVTGVSVVWVVYIAYFNSRLVGYIFTKVLNQIYKDGYIKFGSLSVSVLSGKIMFRDLQYITPDLSLKIYDGYLIFRWWRPYKFGPWRKKRDLSQGHTRLSVVISGMEFHVYNRSHEYQRLEKLFNLNTKVFPSKHAPEKKTSDKKATEKEPGKVAWWRKLIPVIKFSVSYGKLIFGNKLLPSTLVVAFYDASFQYKTTKASNKYDLFMHALEGNTGSVRFTLLNSPKYDPSVLPPHWQCPPNDSPPRKMGDGFDLVHSNYVHFKYSWDEPGQTDKPVDQSKYCDKMNKDTEVEEDTIARV